MSKIARTVFFAALTTYATSAGAVDAEHGRILYEACRACHSERPDATGPSLKGIVGRKSAALSDFRYSGPLNRANLIWDSANLAEYLSNPQAKIRGTRMAFAGIRDRQDVEDLIAWLATLK